VAFGDQAFAQVRAKKSSPSCDQYARGFFHGDLNSMQLVWRRRIKPRACELARGWACADLKRLTKSF